MFVQSVCSLTSLYVLLTPLLIIFSGLVSFPNRLTLFLTPPPLQHGSGALAVSARPPEMAKRKSKAGFSKAAMSLTGIGKRRCCGNLGRLLSNLRYLFSLNLGHPFFSVSLSYEVCPLVGPCGRVGGGGAAPSPEPPPAFLWGCQGSVEGLLINFPFSHTSLFQPWASPFEPSVSFNNALRGCDGLRRLVRGHPSREKGLKGL